MLLVKEQPVYTEWNTGEVLLFPGVFLKLRWEFGINFYRSQDRYGRNRLFIMFPIDARIENAVIHDDMYKTFLLWGKKLEAPSPSGAKVLTVPDIDCPIQHRYYHLISAPMGTKTILRDEDGEEMELTF